MKQRGQFMLSPLMGAVIVVGLLGVAVVVQTKRLEAVKIEYAEFKAGVAAEGRAAEARAKATEDADKKRKTNADTLNDRTLAALRADNMRLRDGRAGGSLVPPAAPGAVNPDRAGFDRTLLDSALRDFDTAAEGLVGEGDEARVKLDTAKRWAQPTPTGE